MKSFITEPRNSNRCSYYCSRRRSPRETSKLDSVNLLYGRDQNEVDNVKSSDSSEKRSRSKFFAFPLEYSSCRELCLDNSISFKIAVTPCTSAMSKEEDTNHFTEIHGARSPRRRITIHRRLVFREPATSTVPNIRLLIFYNLIEIAVLRIVIIAATLTIIAIIVVTTSTAS